MKTFNQSEIQDIADEALNAACRVVQERLGVSNGDLAAHYFQGHTERVIVDILRGYIRTEIQEAGEHAPFEIQTFTFCDGFVNTWSDNEETPVTFSTYADAERELQEFLQELTHAFERGDIEDAPDADDYQIVRVEQ